MQCYTVTYSRHSVFAYAEMNIPAVQFVGEYHPPPCMSVLVNGAKSADTDIRFGTIFASAFITIPPLIRVDSGLSIFNVIYKSAKS